MTADLGDFMIITSHDGDLYLTCYRCWWEQEVETGDLVQVISMAQHHTCQVVVDGVVELRRIMPAVPGTLTVGLVPDEVPPGARFVRITQEWKP